MLTQTVIMVGIFLRSPDYPNDPKRLLANPKPKKGASGILRYCPWPGSE
jgi:hypothetical protein